MSVNQVNQTTGALSPIAGGTLYAAEPIGSVKIWMSNTIPNGYLLCNGQAISKTTYADLYAVIGSTFGETDTTFNVPDLRGEFLRGAGTNSHTNQGSGGVVGAHQDSTAVPYVSNRAEGNTVITEQVAPTGGNRANVVNPDSSYNITTNSVYGSYQETLVSTSASQQLTVRPTNTSVNYIIKATTISLPSDFEAAVDEKIADVTAIEYGVPTIATQNNYSFTNCRYTKSGHVCTAFIQFGVAEPSVSGELLCASDFPKAAQQGANAHFWIFRWDNFGVDPVGGYINQNGNLYLKGGIVGGTMPYAVAFTYITTD